MDAHSSSSSRRARPSAAPALPAPRPTRWDAASRLPLPFGAYCDAFFAGGGADADADADAEADAGAGVAAGADAGAGADAAPQRGAWYPVHVEAADTRVVCASSSASSPASPASAAAASSFRVRFLGFEYATLVPPTHLRPLSREFEAYVALDRARLGARAAAATSALPPAAAAAMGAAADAEAAEAAEAAGGVATVPGRLSKRARKRQRRERDAAVAEVAGEDAAGAGTGDGAGGGADADEGVGVCAGVGADAAEGAEDPRPSKKWWLRRLHIWSRFGGGRIAMPAPLAGADPDEIWFSTTPERAALGVARRALELAAGAGGTGGAASAAPTAPFVVLDLFAGVGGNAVAFARQAGVRAVLAVERDPARCAAIRRNAEAYGVGARVRVVCGCAVAALRRKAAAGAGAAGVAGAGAGVAAGSEGEDDDAEAAALLRDASIVCAAPPWGGADHKRVARRDSAGAFSLARQLAVVAAPPAEEGAGAGPTGAGETVGGVELVRLLLRTLPGIGGGGGGGGGAQWARVRASAIFLPASVEADADFRALAAEAGAAMSVEALRAPWGPIGIAAFVAEESA